MFRSCDDIEKAAYNLDALRNGILINWDEFRNRLFGYLPAPLIPIREVVIASLKINFNTMQSPFEWDPVLKKRSHNKIFPVVKSPCVQIVAVAESSERAKLKLDLYELQHQRQTEHDRGDSGEKTNCC